MAFFSMVLNFLSRLINKLLVTTRLLPDDPITKFGLAPDQPTFYISRLNSISDVAALSKQCKLLGLPDPKQKQLINNRELPRYIALQNPSPLFGSRTKQTTALQQGELIFQALKEHPAQKIQIIPVTILWGRAPGKEKPGIGTLLAHSLSPSWFRKLLVLLFVGRENLIRFSEPLDVHQLLTQKQSSKNLPQKLLRIARAHFKQQKLTATGPKLPSQDLLFQGLLASDSVKQAIKLEAKNKNITEQQAKQNAIKLLNEIAANYHDAMIRVGARILTWLWTKLYNGIEVRYSEQINELSKKGHEIIYIPCHRSHMDYLLLTYVIYNQGIVPPHIAAGINLNFWPAGPIFRRSGAFFIRRTFKGNKLYSTIFKEYLFQLFNKGHSVKFYAEGGRSRTGRLLPPKTGMLAMTIQAMLRDLDRPVTIVPVYLGYEHVMEVNTYLKELAGNVKSNESIFGIFKAIKKLKNYGRGYVNFAEPININTFLSENQKDWQTAISSTETVKPKWLGEQTANLAQQVMVNINQTAALNAVNLLAIILLNSDKQALSETEVLTQLSLYLTLQQEAPYNEKITVPADTAAELLDHALKLNKFDVLSDQFGRIISIQDQEKILLNYYRNNVIHLFAVPSLIARHLIQSKNTTKQACYNLIAQLYPLFACEWFLQPLKAEYVDKVIEQLAIQNLITIEDNNISIMTDNHLSTPSAYSQLDLLARIIGCTLQRYAVVLGLIENDQGINRAQLENDSQHLAARLSTLHNIKTPEFFDKKVLTNLVSGLKNLDLLHTEPDNKLQASTELTPLFKTICQLLEPNILQSIKETISNR